MSALKRRDNKNRILQRGESQRPDGRYTYKYVDALTYMLMPQKLEQTKK